MKDDFEDKEFSDNISGESSDENQQPDSSTQPVENGDMNSTESQAPKQPESSVYRYSKDQIYDNEASNDRQPSGRDSGYHQNSSYGQGGSYGQSNSYGRTGSYGQSGNYSQGSSYGQSGNYSQGSSYGQSGNYSQGSSYGQSGNYSRGSSYGQNGAYGQNSYGRDSAYGPNSSSQDSSYGQNSHHGGNGYYSQNGANNSDGGLYHREYQYQHTAKPAKKPHKNRKLNGFAKVVCYALVFGLVAGVIFEAVHFAGDAIRGNNSKSEVSAEKTIDVVRVSSENVETIEANDVSDIVKEVMPSIVSVNTVVEKTVQDFFGRVYSQEGQGAGSGFLFSQDNDCLYIATNYHVIEDSKSISVSFNDGTSAEASVRGYDETADIAVITVKISELSEDTKQAVKVAVIGDSDQIEAGNSAIAIGNALGYGQSVTTGALSAVNRAVQLTDGEMNLIQTSAAINPGNSGGPLLNARGEVIGINTVKYSETTVEGMGFAIPINSAMETINDIISGKIVNKSDSDSAYFGIKGGTVTESLAEKIGCPQGVYVSYVYDGSAAARAGISQGCIITAFDGTQITTIEELQQALTNYKPGDSVTVEVYTPDSNGNYKNKETLTTILGSKDEAPAE